MTERLGDEDLIAFLDGELDEARERAVAARLETDSGAQVRLAALAQNTALVRAAFDEMLRETVPDRLFAAARPAAPSEPAGATILRFRPAAVAGRLAQRRHWLSVPVAASILGLMVGGGVSNYFSSRNIGAERTASEERIAAATATATTNSWLDNVAASHKLFVSTRSNDMSFADIPAGADNDGGIVQKISQRTSQSDVRVPDLKPWGLAFQGARVIVADGEPATELFYTTDDKAIGPLSVVIANSSRPDLAPTLERRQDVNVMHWRRKGHAYAIAGQADIGYMWGLANDIGWQLDAI